MIKRIKIENFQSHRDTELKFCRGVNVIIGQSDSGKTAVFRALDWACHNRPGGEAFRSDWGGDTRVIVTLTDGEQIIREKKGKTGNSYFLKLRNKEPQEFKAFGKGVPPEISKLLNLHPINLQNQLDPPFLLSRSPGEIASTLNEIVHLDQIDDSLSRALIRSRENASDLRTQRQLLEEAQEDLAHPDFANLDELEKKLQKIEALNRKGNKIEDSIGILESLVREAEESQARLDKSKRLPPLKKKVATLEALVERQSSLIDGIEALRDALEGVQEARSDLKRYETLPKISDRFSAIFEKAQKAKALRDKVEEIEEILEEIDRLTESIHNLGEYVDKLEKQLPKQCPTCGQEVKSWLTKQKTSRS